MEQVKVPGMRASVVGWRQLLGWSQGYLGRSQLLSFSASVHPWQGWHQPHPTAPESSLVSTSPQRRASHTFLETESSLRAKNCAPFFL